LSVSTTSPVTPADPARVRVFVDYWNFQLTLNQREAKARSVADHRFHVDWKKLGPWLAEKACQAASITAHSFEGVIIYTSYDPRTDEGKKFHRWATTSLNRQPGVTVECRERKPKAAPNCPACHMQIATCPFCQQAIRPTQEKGVDTLIATDMVRLAWEDAYDMAVLTTSDRDLIPAVEFLNLKARKIVHAGFPPLGSDLATKCWASFDVYVDSKQIERVL
jgi:uncharacterized LabA/DUF88 family protein